MKRHGQRWGRMPRHIFDIGSAADFILSRGEFEHAG
jgi:hypothetical protein